MMSFYTDREVGRRVTFNGSSFKANSVIYSFNITKTTASVALKTDEGPELGGFKLVTAAEVDGPGNVPNNGVTSQTTAAVALAYECYTIGLF